MKSRVQFVLVPLVLLLGVGAALLMIANRKPVQPRPAEVILPVVRVLTAAPTNLQLVVRSQGTVAPRVQIQLAPEVTGKVATVAPTLVAGGSFEAGDVLVQIEPRDFELAVVRAQAQVAAAEAQLSREEAEAELARLEWQDLNPDRAPPALVAREPQLKNARASLASAQAALEEARRELDKTSIRAPFPGRVLRENVDVGQFVTRGNAIAEIYSADLAEVRLPLPVEEMAHLDLPLAHRGEPDPAAGPTVRLRGQFAGREQVWTGQVVRTEGSIDPQSRMITVVAQVKDPFARAPGTDHPPLPIGLFAEAEILGRQASNVFVVPRTAMRNRHQVLLVDTNSHLRFQNVVVLRAERDQFILSGGLAAGDRVCLSPLNTPVDGAAVRVQPDAPAATPADVPRSSEHETRH